MSPRTRSGGLLVLVSVLTVLGEQARRGRSCRPSPPGLTVQDRPSSPTPTAEQHDHEHEPAPTPSGGHEHEPAAPTDGHGDHGTTPPDAVSTTIKTLVIGGFGVLNAGVIAAAALVRRRQRRTRAWSAPAS